MVLDDLISTPKSRVISLVVVNLVAAFSRTFAAGLLLCLAATPLMAQTNLSAANTWLAAAPVAPEFAVPPTRAAWESRRAEVRRTLWELLGKLPPRPKVPVVTTVTREDRGDYLFEKFTFDNGAGAIVPGYVFLPKNVSGQSPAILYCHWHGGQYDIGKDELLRTNAVPVPP